MDKATLRRIVEGNMGLVITLARRFLPLLEGFPELSKEDLYQEGYIGLWEAGKRYDPSRINPGTGEPYRFSTYAKYYIEDAFRRALKPQVREIGGRSSSEHQDGSGGRSDSEVSGGRIPKGTHRRFDLRARFEEREDFTPGGDGAPLPPYIDGEDLALERRMEAFMASLGPRKQLIWRLRFGVDDFHERSQKDVGRILGLSRERVRQLEE